MASVGLQALVAEPADFIQHLAIQNQLLACLKWLSEFQVLACIPLDGSISIEEIADLASVPETQLGRVVRMMATAGFLHEPHPGHIAHTSLSAPFVTNLAFLDAAMFLAETAAPTALHMPAATQRQGRQSAYSLAFPGSQPFPSACVERTKLQRQWSAYRRCVGDVDDSATELIGRLKWRSLGNACIVDACAQSTEAVMALAEMHPSLQFIVQMIDPAQDCNSTIEGFSGRITVQRRLPAAVQEVTNAAVYILRLTTPFTPLPAQMLAELNAHLNVLRTNATATLILALPLLPEPRAVSADVEAKVRLRDLCRIQLADQREMEPGELLEAINSVSDNNGRLVVVSRLRCPQSATVALGVQYQTFADRTHPVGQIVA
ncbi:uncharacterized protein BDR25DRAFT_296310 [Lindgomyces ingoldianus]|uniref:Uncharacterized protein n=1 Tax=Lindgomyces ingoldianus TaxID=673940 RepID=A0ACB6QCQ6_9PLEO|nr:uncharacterized protein BDR25DRAFT_296310 [Lindgomyces ingoldianus]KAF2464733.1 hypothetical protein BDR25DRAFT_296310 [Lindgomyces ingoldianus]